MTEDGQQLLATSFGSAAVVAPGSGATITLWSSAANVAQSTTGVRYKRLVIFNYVSHVSATSGLQIDVSVDNVNWRNLVSYTIAATTPTYSFVAVASPFVRVRYVNSASVLTTWEMSITGDQTERASQ